MVWQPIETAPKDNRRPLWLARFNGDTLQSFDYNGSWERECESWEMPEVYYFWASENGNVEEPTHWAYQPDEFYTLSGAQPAPDSYATGINAVAAMLQSKADEYAKEHGHDDMGGLSFGPGMGGEIKMDYYTNLIELVDDVRTMLADASDGWKAIEARVTGAQPAPSVPEVTDAMALAFHRALTDGSIGAREVEEIKDALRAALAAAPGSSRDDQHAGGLKALNHQGLMERARQNAKKEAGLIYPDDDARREEKEQELASEYYRQYTTPNP